MDKKIGIVLINYQDYAARFLEPCRDSLCRQSYPQELVRVYIVDNASTKETADYLKSVYPEAEILPRPDGNYAAANNLGFKVALQDGCQYVVSANMDTEMEVDWLKELVLALDNNPQAGLAQSKVLLYPRNELEKIKPRINSYGNLIHFLGFGFTSGYNQEDDDSGDNLYPSIKGYASGCSFIARREVLEAINVEDLGYYNEEYYMYHDDLEISLKVKLAGYQIILAPRSRIFHKYEFTRSTRMIYYMERNRYLTMLIFYPKFLLVLIALPALVMDIGMVFYAFLGGWIKEELKIYQYFFKSATYDKIAQERERVKKISKTSFNSLAHNFVGKIEFQEIANPILSYIVNPLMNLYWRLIKKII